MAKGRLIRRDEIQAYYSDQTVVQGYEKKRFSGPNYLKHLNERRVILWAAQQRRPDPFLEIAVGTGRLSLALLGDGYRGIALDFSRPMLAHARARSEAQGLTSSWVRGDAFRLPFRDASFDFVVTYRFLRHFRPDDRGVLWHELHRVLAGGGWLLLDVPNQRLHRDRDSRFIYDEVYTVESFQAEIGAYGLNLQHLFGNEYRFLSRRPLAFLWHSRRLVIWRSWFETWVLSRIPLLHREALLWSVVCQKSS